MGEERQAGLVTMGVWLLYFRAPGSYTLLILFMVVITIENGPFFLYQSVLFRTNL